MYKWVQSSVGHHLTIQENHFSTLAALGSFPDYNCLLAEVRELNGSLDQALSVIVAREHSKMSLRANRKFLWDSLDPRMEFGERRGSSRNSAGGSPWNIVLSESARFILLQVLTKTYFPLSPRCLFFSNCLGEEIVWHKESVIHLPCKNDKTLQIVVHKNTLWTVIQLWPGFGCFQSGWKFFFTKAVKSKPLTSCSRHSCQWGCGLTCQSEVAGHWVGGKDINMQHTQELSIMGCVGSPASLELTDEFWGSSCTSNVA